MVSPVAVFQQALVEFTRGQAWKFIFEIDRARALLVAQVFSAEGHQFAYQGLVCKKGRLGDAIVAHAITNFLLGLWVVIRGDYIFW